MTDPHIAALVRSMDEGFRFLHLRDGAEVTAIHAERWRHGAVDAFTVREPEMAFGLRLRTEDYPHGDPLWQRCGSVAEVVAGLLELPPHGGPGAPTRTAGARMWLPSDVR
ncbi:hypothetical protein [Amycolatopsis cihanbeyliensis]|uniref:Uncharacterized protein n=1 Tax=Amycolatopsis cihanbeyliensis TaxID=1128664 RepID=A0A542DL52_AMYCI|nr:hypothetical protein [Amycolatopsis cihanbeyliensis]TQJ03665.1 hypothetical protein FB471_3429 [Amycolatopsis cihanbeyliensis]